MAKVYLSPSKQFNNAYAWGNTTEGEQCGRIGTACKAALERCGIEVMMEHKGVEIEDRCKHSNAWGADLHVPIHTNAYNGRVSGTRMFCYNSSGNGYKACKAIFDVLAPISPGTSESIKASPGLYEVRAAAAPTAYIETDFHDVPYVAQWIVEHTTEIGEAIAHGICNYFGIAYKRPAQPEATPADTGDKLYRVQVGAYAVRANAENMLAKLKAAGFNGFIKQD